MKQATKTVSNLKYDLFWAIGHQECITRAKFLEVLDVGELRKKVPSLYPDLLFA